MSSLGEEAKDWIISIVVAVVLAFFIRQFIVGRKKKVPPKLGYEPPAPPDGDPPVGRDAHIAPPDGDPPAGRDAHIAPPDGETTEGGEDA